jgi:protein-tyrosine phosphatase
MRRHLVPNLRRRRKGNVDRIGVLFVCLGNICRSPLAEGIFLDLVAKRGLPDRFDVDSCGTGGWHHGEPADHRSIRVAEGHGLALDHCARQFNPRLDPERFRWIIAMDRSNVRNLIGAGAPPDHIRMIRSFDPALLGKADSELEVPDPYEWAGNGFEDVYRMLDSACRGLLDFLVDEMQS